MTWFYKVLHLYMTQDVPGRPPRLAHEETLENEQVMDDHVVDVLLHCQTIMWLTRVGIEIRVFAKGGDEAIALAHSITFEAWSVVTYRRQKRNQSVRIMHTQ